MISRLWRRIITRLARACQHWRMIRVARQPCELTAQVAHARTVLFVCHGNIIRSAFAAELMRSRSLGRAAVRIRSAGLEAKLDGPAHPTAVECASRFGVDLGAHRTHRLDRSDIEEADILLAMEVDHVLEIHRRFPEHRDKVYLLGCFTDESPLDIADPVYLAKDVFQACFERIDRSVRRIIELLPTPPGAPAPTGQTEYGMENSCTPP
jgi:protein-tyrosine-phosphatase